MQIITLQRDAFPHFSMVTGDLGFVFPGHPAPKLPRGARVVLTEINANNPQGMFSGAPFTMQPAALRPWRWPESLAGKSILLIRPGGVGDLLFLTPTMRKIKATWPDCSITVAAFSHFLPILRENPDVDRMIFYPFLAAWLDDYDFHVDFEGVIEENREAETTPAVDMIARWVGMELAPEERGLRLEITGEERWPIRELRKREDDRLRVGIQLSASSIIRCYPDQNWQQVILGLLKANCRVFILGDGSRKMRWGRIIYDKKGKPIREALPDPPGLTTLLGKFKDVKRAAVFAESLDLLICPDSAFVHIAGALRKPCVALYGPFPSGVRTKYYEMCLSLDADRATCARMPCYLHGGDPCPEASGDPWSPCMTMLPPQAVLDPALVILDSIRRELAA